MGFKCQFAHSKEELRQVNDVSVPSLQTYSHYQILETGSALAGGRNRLTTKLSFVIFGRTVRFSFTPTKDQACAFGQKCTYAHGDLELKQA
jgi:hypothetical protein